MQFDTVQGNNALAENTTFRYKADVQVVYKAGRHDRHRHAADATVSTAQTFDWLRAGCATTAPTDGRDHQLHATRCPRRCELTGTPVFTVTSRRPSRPPRHLHRRCRRHRP